MNSTAQRVIIVDDDPLNNAICRYVVKKVVSPETEILDFVQPEKALEFINTSNKETLPATVLLLDINMPGLSGWEFLDVFEGISKEIRDRFRIYIVSSSVDTRDKQRAAANEHVLQFFEKPLTVEKIAGIF